ncbi:MAG: trypsin-like peptidase domain-containing protein [Planctomycetota bacterium]
MVNLAGQVVPDQAMLSVRPMLSPVPVYPASRPVRQEGCVREIRSFGGCGDCMRWFLNSASAVGVVAALLVAQWAVPMAIADGVAATSYKRETASSRSRETPTVRAIRLASPAVVNLHGQKTVRAAARTSGGDSSRQVNGMGTGVVIDERGFVVTNYHVVQDVGDINVTLHDGTSTRADLIASDARSDLALVKLRVDQPLPTIPRGRSDDLMIGETVIAIGNAFGYVHTSTQGIISALHRDIPVNETQEYRDLIQTSAGINPGNSGGPLLNIDGEMIGVNVAVRVGAQQIAFAIPIDQVLDTVTDMVARDNDRRGLIGMSGQSDGRGGFRLTSVASGGAAEAGGLKRGDRITMVGQIPVLDELQCALSLMELHRLGDTRVEFERDGDTYETNLVANSVSQTSETVSGRAWSVLGVTTRPLSQDATRQLNSRLRTEYRGGLAVTNVRSGSAADQEGIRTGDILLGIHSWETASTDDLAGILDHPRIRRGGEAKFFIVRRNQTLFGHMRLAAQTDAITSSRR